MAGTGLQDLVAPNLLVFSPKPGTNSDNGSTFAYNGLVGTAFGDAKAATVKVYPCANCTNVAPVQTLAATVSGAGWSATGAALPTGVYTVEVTQTDWAGNTTSVVRGMESRDAIFVSATGNDANAGTAAAPKLTINAGLAAAATKSEVVVGQGTYGAASLAAANSNKALRGGFDQYAGWARPGTAGTAGTPSQNLTNVEAGGTAILVNAATGVTIDSLRAPARRRVRQPDRTCTASVPSPARTSRSRTSRPRPTTVCRARSERPEGPVPTARTA